MLLGSNLSVGELLHVAAMVITTVVCKKMHRSDVAVVSGNEEDV